MKHSLQRTLSDLREMREWEMDLVGGGGATSTEVTAVTTATGTATDEHGNQYTYMYICDYHDYYISD